MIFGNKFKKSEQNVKKKFLENFGLSQEKYFVCQSSTKYANFDNSVQNFDQFQPNFLMKS